MNDQGWIKFYREVLDKAIWKNSTGKQNAILATILLLANHDQNEWEWKGKKYYVKPGQFITSLSSIAKNSGKDVSIQNVRTALKRLEKLGFLTNESTNESRLITIVNWGKYQGVNNESNKGSNKHLTNDQQAPNKHLTTNNNDNNDNNEKNDNNNDDDKAEYVTKINGLIKNKISSSSLESFINRFGVDTLKSLIDEIKVSDYLKENINFNHLSDDFINKAISGKYRTFKNEVNNEPRNKLPKDFSQFNL